MSLIHDALEKARKNTSKMVGERFQERVEKKRKYSLWLILIPLIAVSLTVLIGYKFYEKINEAQKKALVRLTDHKVEDRGDSNQLLDANGFTSSKVDEHAVGVVSLNFRESFNKALNAGNTEFIKELAINYPDSLSSADFEKVLKIFITLDDRPMVLEIAKKADDIGKLNARFLLELANYLEQKDDVVSAYYYRRAYFAGHTDPILLAKAGTLYDKAGMRDSAVKYYRAYLNVADTGDLYFNIKRRFDYLASGK